MHPGVPGVSRPLIVLFVLLALVGGGFVAEAHRPSRASAATCAKWNVSGVWNGQQSNVGGLRFTFRQSGTGAVTGNASYSGASGSLSGSLKGSTLDFIVSWSDGKRGHYSGTVNARSISGRGFDVATPTSTASWSLTGTAVCTAQTEPPTSTYPALPNPDPNDATARMMDIQPPGGGVTVIRGGKTYSASETSQLQTGDIIKTDKNTRALFEFLVGGRVGIYKGVEVKMINSRAASTSHTLSLTQKRTMAAVGAFFLAYPILKPLPPPPIEFVVGGHNGVAIKG